MIERELRSTLTRDSFALKTPMARLMFRRPPKFGKCTYAAISAHWSNTTTKRRILACELLGELKKKKPIRTTWISTAEISTCQHVDNKGDEPE